MYYVDFIKNTCSEIKNTIYLVCLKSPRYYAILHSSCLSGNDLDGFYHRLMDSNEPNQLVDFLFQHRIQVLGPEFPLF